MNSRRLYFTLMGVIALLFIAFLGAAYGVNNILSARSQALTHLKAQSLALQQEQTSLIKSKKDIKTYANLDKISRSIVPEDKDQAEAVREIVNIAGANGVSLAAITFPASTLGTTGAKAGTGAPASAASTAPSAGGSKAAALSQLQPVKNIPGIYQLQITVQSDPNQPVPYSRFTGFLTALEHNRRTAQVSTISIQPTPTNRNVLSFTLTLNEYIKP